ncbi:MAG: VWA domain-containing protein [Chloroflexi bacterium]|nr:MAG: VWA domain-containing protein [Chloroflexota bacterium]MBL1196063.1 VWA domain-containing protein [Chloroflexota bacterium]NOH13357.1 VWA domain-containing protein [Chloroflexota bacterium]
MNFLTPAALGLAAIALPIILLYMLKLRRQPVQISSTMLWQMLLRDRQANTPWQRLKRNLLLLLQLLILAALVIALARPFTPIPTVASGSVVVVLDGSASMLASDVSPSRFEAAQDAAEGIIAGLSSNSQMTLILANAQPQTLISNESNKGALRQALSEATPRTTETDWSATLALAAGANSGASSGTTIIISDGGLPNEGLPPLPGEIRFVPIGASGENLAISALALRATTQGADLLASVTNYGESQRSALVSLYRNGELFDAQRVSIAPGETASVVQSGLPDESAVYEARLEDDGENWQDQLASDNQAFATYTPGGEGRTLFVSKGNFFLEQVLTSLPDIEPFRLVVESGEVVLPTGSFDLYIFDGVLPEELPEGNLLLVNPPDNELFNVLGEISEVSGVTVTDNPLNRFVDFSAVNILKTRQIETPDWADVLVDSESGSLVFAGETGGRKVAVVGFDLRDSDLPLQITFPILFGNLANYLSPGLPFDASAGLQPGEGLNIRPFGNSRTVQITTPSRAISEFQFDTNGLLYTDTQETGIYTIRAGEEAHTFAVNLFSSAESNLSPQTEVQIGRTEIGPTSESALGELELWPWLAGLGLLILLVEWWVYQGRQIDPQVWRQRLGLGKARN